MNIDPLWITCLITFCFGFIVAKWLCDAIRKHLGADVTGLLQELKILDGLLEKEIYENKRLHNLIGWAAAQEDTTIMRRMLVEEVQKFSQEGKQ